MRCALLLLALAACCKERPAPFDGNVKLRVDGAVYSIYNMNTRILTVTEEGRAAGVTCK